MPVSTIAPSDRIAETVKSEIEKLQETRAAQAAMLADTDAEISRLRGMLPEGSRRRARAAKPTDAHKAAGPSVIAKVREVITEIGEGTQAEITRRAGKHSGSVSWALKALEQDGEVEKLDRREKGSFVFKVTGKARRAPGS
jgi:hypothetical protein